MASVLVLTDWGQLLELVSGLVVFPLTLDDDPGLAVFLRQGLMEPKLALNL